MSEAGEADIIARMASGAVSAPGVRWRKLGPTGMLGAAWTAAPPVCGTFLLVYLGVLSDWLLLNPSIGLLLYVSVFIAAAGFGLLPTYSQSVLGGWVFGLWFGLPAALAGFTGGALIGYYIARRVSSHHVQDIIERNPKAQAIRDSLVGKGFWRTLMVVALLRLSPTSPFSLTNLVMAATGVRVLPYAVGTCIGMLPRTGLAVVLAAMAAQTGARDIQSFVSERGAGVLILGVALLIVALSIIGVLARHALRKLQQQQQQECAAS